MIKQLQDIQFHDLILVSITFEFERQSIRFVIEQFNDDSQEYDQIRIEFKKVRNVVLSEFVLEAPKIELINKVEMIGKKILFEVILSEGPSGKIEFEYEDYELDFIPFKLVV